METHVYPHKQSVSVLVSRSTENLPEFKQNNGEKTSDDQNETFENQRLVARDDIETEASTL